MHAGDKMPTSCFFIDMVSSRHHLTLQLHSDGALPAFHCKRSTDLHHMLENHSSPARKSFTPAVPPAMAVPLKTHHPTTRVLLSHLSQVHSGSLLQILVGLRLLGDASLREGPVTGRPAKRRPCG